MVYLIPKDTRGFLLRNGRMELWIVRKDIRFNFDAIIHNGPNLTHMVRTLLESKFTIIQNGKYKLAVPTHMVQIDAEASATAV